MQQLIDIAESEGKPGFIVGLGLVEYQQPGFIFGIMLPRQAYRLWRDLARRGDLTGVYSGWTRRFDGRVGNTRYTALITQVSRKRNAAYIVRYWQ